MIRKAFETEIVDDGANLIGPWRSPRQMLAEQVYDDYVSIHDDATAQRLGFKGGAIEGPTHFSQFAPLGERLWGATWFETGLPFGALPQPRLRRRKGAGDHIQADRGRA